MLESTAKERKFRGRNKSLDRTLESRVAGFKDAHEYFRSDFHLYDLDLDISGYSDSGLGYQYKLVDEKHWRTPVQRRASKYYLNKKGEA